MEKTRIFNPKPLVAPGRYGLCQKNWREKPNISKELLMDEKQENIEKAIYAIIAMSKNDIQNLESNLEFEGVLQGINGTCFFISPNTFITAHHCLNQEYAKDQIYFLINKNGRIINGVKIDFEDSDSDMCVGKIDISIDTYCKLPNKTSIVGGQKFTAYGFSAKDTQNFKIKIIKENDKIKIIKHDSLILKKVEYNYVHNFLLKNHLSSDYLQFINKL